MPRAPGEKAGHLQGPTLGAVQGQEGEGERRGLGGLS
jgi:hypothetical protein